MGRVKEEAWSLNSGDTTAIPAANRANGTASTWSDIWKYQVPTGQAHILKPGHHFSLYLYDASGECTAGKGRVRIVVRDQSEQDEKSVFGPALYETCKNFNDVTKMATLGLQNDLVVEEKFLIVFQIYEDEAATESSSYFKLETIRIRSSI